MAVSRETLCNLLAMLMSEISENCMCAGWLADLEYTLWEAVIGKPLSWRWQTGITKTELQMLKELSAEIDDWIVWDDHADDKDDTDPMENRKYVPLTEWLNMYEVYGQRLSTTG